MLAPLAAVLVAACVLAIRFATEPAANTSVSHTTRARLVPLPSSPAIEAGWGIRFTGFFLMADRGLIDIRYQVVDPAKSGRIHGGRASPDPNAALKAMPTLIDEANHKRVPPTSALLHFEHFHFQTELLGNTYSIIYGNAGGALHVGDKVTIEMADHTRLQHIVVAN